MFSCLLFLILVLISTLVTTTNALRFEEATGLDWLFVLRGPRPAPENIAIVAMNSRAAHALALPSPNNWPRTIYAETIDRLKRAGAHPIVLDIAFRNKRSINEDTLLSDAIIRANNIVLYKYLRRRQVISDQGTVDIEEEISPPNILSQGAAAIGAFTLPKNAGRVYWTQLYQNLATGPEAAQPLLALMLINREATESLYYEMSKTSASADQHPIHLQDIAAFFFEELSSRHDFAQQLIHHADANKDPINKSLAYGLSLIEPMYINYYGPPRSLTTIDIDHVLSANEDELRSWFSNKVVYIGYSDDSQTEQKDNYATVYSLPSGVDLSGVEISATVLANLLDRSALQMPPSWLKLVITACAIVMATAIMWRLPFWVAVLLQVFIATAYSMSALLLFSRHALWLPLATPLLAACCANLWVLLAKYRQGLRNEARIAKTLEQYLPAAAARELGTSLAGMEKRHRIVHGVCMMTDIKGYTGISENCGPDELHILMNRYYAILIEEVERQKGMVANIVGDSLLALWTGPAITEDVCERAWLATDRIAKRLNAIEDHCAQLPTCFALHAGQFSLGNLGADGHYEYSPIGDIINTTARIEKLNRALGTQKLASEVVVHNLSASFRANYSIRYLGHFNLRNKSNTLKLSTFAELDTSQTAEQKAIDAYFSCALKAYEAGDRTSAKRHLIEILQYQPDDGPSLYYLSQCD